MSVCRLWPVPIRACRDRRRAERRRAHWSCGAASPNSSRTAAAASSASPVARPLAQAHGRLVQELLHERRERCSICSAVAGSTSPNRRSARSSSCSRIVLRLSAKRGDERLHLELAMPAPERGDLVLDDRLDLRNLAGVAKPARRRARRADRRRRRGSTPSSAPQPRARRPRERRGRRARAVARGVGQALRARARRLGRRLLGARRSDREIGPRESVLELVEPETSDPTEPCGGLHGARCVCCSRRRISRCRARPSLSASGARCGRRRRRARAVPEGRRARLRRARGPWSSPCPETRRSRSPRAPRRPAAIAVRKRSARGPARPSRPSPARRYPEPVRESRLRRARASRALPRHAQRWRATSSPSCTYR